MQVRRARAADLDGVLAVLDDTAQWLAARGIEQWPAGFDPERLRPAIAAGEVHVCLDEGRPVGTFSLLWADPVIWGGLADEDDAGYVHQLAVARSHAGRRLGERLLDAAGELAAAAGRRWLRLDCVAHNGALRRYYERAGFEHCGDVDHLPRVHPSWQVASRYQRPTTVRLHSQGGSAKQSLALRPAE